MVKNLLIVLAPGLRQDDIHPARLPTAARWAQRGLRATFVDLPLPATEHTLQALFPPPFWGAVRRRTWRIWNWDPSHPASLFLPFHAGLAAEVEAWLRSSPQEPFIGFVNANVGFHRWGIAEKEWEEGYQRLNQWLAQWEAALEATGLGERTVLLLTSPFGRVEMSPLREGWLEEPAERILEALAPHGIEVEVKEVRPRTLWLAFPSEEERRRAEEVFSRLSPPWAADWLPCSLEGHPSLCLLAPVNREAPFRPMGYLPEAEACLPDWSFGGGTPEETDVPLLFVGGGVPSATIPFFRWEDVAPTLAQWAEWEEEIPSGRGQAYPTPLSTLPCALRFGPARLDGEERVEHWPLHLLPEGVREEVFFAARRRWGREVSLWHLFTLAAPRVARRWERWLEEQGFVREGLLWRRGGEFFLVQPIGFLVFVGQSGDPSLLLRLGANLEQGYQGPEWEAPFPAPRAGWGPGVLWGDGHAHSLWSDGLPTLRRRIAGWREGGLHFGILTDHWGEEGWRLTAESYLRCYVPQILARLEEAFLALPGVEVTPPAVSANNHLLLWFVSELPAKASWEGLSHRGLARWGQRAFGWVVLAHAFLNLHGDELEGLHGLEGSSVEVAWQRVWSQGWLLPLLGGSDIHGHREEVPFLRFLVWAPEGTPNGLREALERGRVALQVIHEEPEAWVEPLLRLGKHGPGGEVMMEEGSEVEVEWGGACASGLERVELWRNGRLWEAVEGPSPLLRRRSKFLLQETTLLWVRAVAQGGKQEAITAPVRILCPDRPLPKVEPVALYPGLLYHARRGDFWEIQPLFTYTGSQWEWPVHVRFLLQEPAEKGSARLWAEVRCFQATWHPHAFNTMPSLRLPLPAASVQEGKRGEPLSAEESGLPPVLELWVEAEEEGGEAVPLAGYSVTVPPRAVRLAVLRWEWGGYEVEPEIYQGGEFLFDVRRAGEYRHPQGLYVGGWHEEGAFRRGALLYQWLGKLPVGGVRARHLLPGWDYRVIVDAFFLHPLTVQVCWNAARIATVRGEGGPVRWIWEVPGPWVGNEEEYLLFDTPRWFPHETPYGALSEVAPLAQRRQPVAFAIARIHLVPLRFNPRPRRGSDEYIPALD